jgi:hypothetical protein
MINRKGVNANLSIGTYGIGTRVSLHQILSQ